MAGAASYRPNHKGFAQLAVSPGIRRAIHAAAEKGKAYAEGISQDFRRTGDYADSFEVADLTVVDFKTKYGAGPRAASRIVNTSGHAAAVEWGHEGRAGEPSTSAHHVLGRTAAQLGSAEE